MAECPCKLARTVKSRVLTKRSFQKSVFVLFGSISICRGPVLGSRLVGSARLAPSGAGTHRAEDPRSFTGEGRGQLFPFAERELLLFRGRLFCILTALKRVPFFLPESLNFHALKNVLFMFLWFKGNLSLLDVFFPGDFSKWKLQELGSALTCKSSEHVATCPSLASPLAIRSAVSADNPIYRAV